MRARSRAVYSVGPSLPPSFVSPGFHHVEPLTIVLFVVGIGLLLVGARYSCEGGRLDLARCRWGSPPVVVGLTVVAFGTSRPRGRAVERGSPPIYRWRRHRPGVMWWGETILNILLHPGALRPGGPPHVLRQLLPASTSRLMIGVSFLRPLLRFLNGTIGRRGGDLVLFVGDSGLIPASWYRKHVGGEADRGAGPHRHRLEVRRLPVRGMRPKCRPWWLLGMVDAGLGSPLAGGRWAGEIRPPAGGERTGPFGLRW